MVAKNLYVSIMLHFLCTKLVNFIEVQDKIFAGDGGISYLKNGGGYLQNHSYEQKPPLGRWLS